MKQRLMSILLISVLLVISLIPGGFAASVSFDEAALNQYLNAWQQQYAAENFRQIDLEDALLGDEETWGFLVYGESCTMGYDFDTGHFFALIPEGGSFEKNLQDIVFYAGDQVLHPLNLEFDEELGYLFELSDAAWASLLNSREFTLRLSYGSRNAYVDITQAAHAVLYQMGQHVKDAVAYCVYSSDHYQSAALLPEKSAAPLPAGNADTGFVSDYVAINEKAQSMFLVEIYNEKDQAIATGSGFVAFDEHLFITNHHVIDEAAYLVVYDDVGRSYRVDSLLAADEALDIAILEFDQGASYAALDLKSHPELLRGQPVIAIGSPKGVKNTVSSGNISALLQENGAEIIQFTAPASHGSSGGALFDDAGSVIGLVFAKHSEGENMNYALNIQWVIDFRKETAHNRPQSLAVYNHLVEETPAIGNVNNLSGFNWSSRQTQTPAPAGEYTRYTHPVLGYTLEYPTLWVMMDSSNAAAIRYGETDLDLSGLDWDSVYPQIMNENLTAFADYLGYSSDFDVFEFSSNISIACQDVGMELTAEDLLTLMPDLRADFTQSLPGIEFINEGVVYEAGSNSYCLLSYVEPTDDYDLYNYQFYISNGADLYLIMLTLADNVIDINQVEEYADHLLATLKFPGN